MYPIKMFAGVGSRDTESSAGPQHRGGREGNYDRSEASVKALLRKRTVEREGLGN